MKLRKVFFLLLGFCFLAACSGEGSLDKPKPAFVFKGSGVFLDSVPPEYEVFVNKIGQLGFVQPPGCVIVPDNKKMFDIVGQMAVVGYDPIYLVDDFGFAEKLTKRFGRTTFLLNYKFGQNTVKARLNWNKASYLAGAIGAMMVENHRFAYLGCDSVSGEAFAQINSFALGARFVDPTAEVSWIKLSVDKKLSFADQLKKIKKEDYGLLVLGENSKELEAAVQKLRCPFIGFGQDSQKQRMARFYYNYTPLWVRTLQDFVLDSLSSSYDYGLRDYSVGLTEYGKNIPQEKIFLLDSVLVHIDSSQIFVGPIFDKNDNLRVNYGDTIIDAEIRFMDWVVKGVGE